MKKEYFIQLLLTLFLAIFVYAVIVKNLTHPLTSSLGGDTDFWDYMGYYFYANISFFEPAHFFLPHIDFQNTQHLYPYGGDHVFQGWVVEACLWYALFYKFFGAWGNWLGLYYIVSTLVLFNGVLWFLRKEMSFQKRLFVAILLTFFNFYALQRYPEHLSHAVHHWLTLSILTDFLLFKKYYDNQKIGLIEVLIKVLLLILVLGLEIGYVSGYALTSFTIVFLFTISLFFTRNTNLFQIKNHVKKLAQQYKGEFFEKKVVISFIIILIFSFAYLYIGIVAQIFFEVKKFGNPETHGNWWVNPLKILLPFYRVFIPDDTFLFNNDATEGPVQGIIGWFLLFLGSWGIIKMKKNERFVLLPFLLLLLLCIFYHPVHFPTLKIFPWFAYSRVPGRATIIYPTLFILFSFPALQWAKHISHRIVWGIILTVGVLEFGVNYSYKFKDNSYNYHFDANFKNYMETVKNAPGEAIFDYPFCIIGGNGVGKDENLAPLYATNANVSTMQRFHQKKTVGHYYGRLQKEQIKEQVKHGWGNLMIAKNNNPFQRQRLKVCLNDKQLEEFANFVKQNDFAGVNLYVDLLPDEACKHRFIDKFGLPEIQTVVPSNGKVLFLRKPKEWFIEEDLLKAKNINFSIP